MDTLWCLWHVVSQNTLDRLCCHGNVSDSSESVCFSSVTNGRHELVPKDVREEAEKYAKVTHTGTHTCTHTDTHTADLCLCFRTLWRKRMTLMKTTCELFFMFYSCWIFCTCFSFAFINFSFENKKVEKLFLCGVFLWRHFSLRGRVSERARELVKIVSSTLASLVMVWLWLNVADGPPSLCPLRLFRNNLHSPKEEHDEHIWLCRHPLPVT